MLQRCPLSSLSCSLSIKGGPLDNTERIHYSFKSTETNQRIAQNVLATTRNMDECEDLARLQEAGRAGRGLVFRSRC